MRIYEFRLVLCSQVFLNKKITVDDLRTSQRNDVTLDIYFGRMYSIVCISIHIIQLAVV